MRRTIHFSANSNDGSEVKLRTVIVHAPDLGKTRMETTANCGDEGSFHWKCITVALVSQPNPSTIVVNVNPVNIPYRD